MTQAVDSSSAAGPYPGRPPERSRRAGIRDVLVLVLAATALAAALLGPLEGFRISSASMTPTLLPGDRVLVNQLAYRSSHPARGDVIAFEEMERPGVAVKRVVALPGDTVEIRDGTLYLNGRPLREPYLHRRPTGSGFFGPTVVPRAHVFVLGDNRARSIDSRFTGPVPTRRVMGRVTGLLWPPDRVAVPLPAPQRIR